MLPLSQIAILSPDKTLQDAILAMTKFPTGCCSVVDAQGVLMGILVEGDIRRYFAASPINLEISLLDIINTSPLVIDPETRAYEAMQLMEGREMPISLVPVVDNKKLIGLIRLHDLLKEGFGKVKDKSSKQ